jgi:hypothetical protein
MRRRLAQRKYLSKHKAISRRSKRLIANRVPKPRIAWKRLPRKRSTLANICDVCVTSPATTVADYIRACDFCGSRIEKSLKNLRERRPRRSSF